MNVNKNLGEKIIKNMLPIKVCRFYGTGFLRNLENTENLEIEKINFRAWKRENGKNPGNFF